MKYYNNDINILVEIAKKYVLYYDNFFEIADNYQNRVIKAIDLAKENGIIESKREGNIELTPIQVYNGIVENLKDKKILRDNGIKSSINISELDKKMAIVRIFRLI